jgi:hypothetical protein
MYFVGKLFKQFLPIMVIFGIRYLPFDEDQNLLFGRALYAAKLIITVLIAAMVYVRIQSTPYKPSDVVKEHEDSGHVVSQMGFADYDKTQVTKFLKAQVMPVAITLFIHYKFNYVQPLYIQFAISMISIYDWPLFQIYVLKRDGSGDKSLRRPFENAKAPGFMETMNKKIQEANEQVDNKKQK